MTGILTLELAGALLNLIGFYQWASVRVNKALSVLLLDPFSVKENWNSFFGLRFPSWREKVIHIGLMALFSRFLSNTALIRYWGGFFVSLFFICILLHWASRDCSFVWYLISITFFLASISWRLLIWLKQVTQNVLARWNAASSVPLKY